MTLRSVALLRLVPCDPLCNKPINPAAACERQAPRRDTKYKERGILRRVAQPLNFRVPDPLVWKGPGFRLKPSPVEPPESGNEVEVPVFAYKREGMLAAQRGNPKIVGGNGLTFPFQLETDT